MMPRHAKVSSISYCEAQPLKNQKECVQNSDCGENAVCGDGGKSGLRKCLCPLNYLGDARIACRKSCSSIEPCGSNSICLEGNGNTDAVCRCLPGYYQNNDGSCHAICDIPCSNGGTCIGPNLCSCMVEFSGSHCQYRCPGKRPVYMQRHRMFYSSYNKHDKHRHLYYKCYNGRWILAIGDEENCKNCIRPPAVCDPHCLNGGICLESGKCKCKHGYVGPQCQYSICNPPCLNGGKCLGINSCRCIIGYTGTYCETPVCNPKCENGGVCKGPNICFCTKSYVGSHCQFSKGKFSFVDNDPHFVVRVPNFQQPICFDMHGKDGEILNLIQDNVSGTMVNGLINKVQSLPTSTNLITLSLKLPSVNLTITTRSIDVDYWKTEKQKKKRKLRKLKSRSCTSNHESANQDKVKCRDVLFWKKMRRLRYGKSKLHLKKKQELHISIRNMRESIVVQRQSSRNEWNIRLHSDNHNKILEGKEVVGVILGESVGENLSPLDHSFYVNLFLTVGVISILVTAENIVINHSEIDDSQVSWNNQKIYKYKYAGNQENYIVSNCTNTKFFTRKNVVKCRETYSWDKKLSLRFGSTTVAIKRNHKIYITEEANKFIMVLSKSVPNDKHWVFQIQKYDNIGIRRKEKIIDFSVRALTTKDAPQTRSSYFTQLFLVLPDFNITIATNSISLHQSTYYKKKTQQADSFIKKICNNNTLLSSNMYGKYDCTDKFTWRKAFTHKYGNTKISVKRRRRLHIYINNGEAHFVVTRTRNKARQWFLGFYVQEQHFFSEFTQGIIGEFLTKVIGSVSTNITDKSSMKSKYSVQLSLFKRIKHRRYKLSEVNAYDRVSDIETINKKRRSLLKKVHVDCLFVQNTKSILNEEFNTYKRQCLNC